MRVNTEELERQAMEIRRIAARLDNLESSVSQISRILCREQFGEQFRPPLLHAAVTIARGSEDLLKMSAALRQISQLYEKTEIRIMDEADHANIHFGYLPVDLIRIPHWIIPPVRPHPGPFRPVLPEDIWEAMEWLPEVPEWPDDTPNEAVDGLLVSPDRSIRDYISDRVIQPPAPGPAPRPGEFEEVIRGLFENLPDGMDLLGAQGAHSQLTGPDASGLIDWTPWEP